MGLLLRKPTAEFGGSVLSVGFLIHVISAEI